MICNVFSFMKSFCHLTDIPGRMIDFKCTRYTSRANSTSFLTVKFTKQICENIRSRFISGDFLKHGLKEMLDLEKDYE